MSLMLAIPALVEWHFTPAVALAAVATIGYWLGKQRRAKSLTQEKTQDELRRALALVREFERVAQSLTRNMAQHRLRTEKFQTQVESLRSGALEGGSRQLCLEAEELLRPTLRWANQISQAYDDIRHQCHQLTSFTDVRTDSLTGLGNRRAMDESLSNQVALRTRYGVPFSLIVFDIDHFKQINDEHGHLTGDRVLQSVAQILDNNVRDTDEACRYGGEEFVVLLPQTDLAGAAQLAERLRETIAQTKQATVSGGVAAVLEWETGVDLLSRADAALYAAKAGGRNRIMAHNGETPVELSQVPAPLAEESVSPSEPVTV